MPSAPLLPILLIAQMRASLLRDIRDNRQFAQQFPPLSVGYQGRRRQATLSLIYLDCSLRCLGADWPKILKESRKSYWSKR